MQQSKDDFKYVVSLSDGSRIRVIQPVAVNVMQSLDRPRSTVGSVTLAGYDENDEFRSYKISGAAIVSVSVDQDSMQELQKAAGTG